MGKLGKEKEKEKEKGETLGEPGAGNRVGARFRRGEEREESDDGVGSKCCRMEIRAHSGGLQGTPVLSPLCGASEAMRLLPLPSSFQNL